MLLQRLTIIFYNDSIPFINSYSYDTLHQKIQPLINFNLTPHKPQPQRTYPHPTHHLHHPHNQPSTPNTLSTLISSSSTLIITLSQYQTSITTSFPTPMHSPKIPPHFPLPTNPINALNDPNWKWPRKKKYDVVIENKMWDLVPYPSNSNVIWSLWFLSIIMFQTLTLKEEGTAWFEENHKWRIIG